MSPNFTCLLERVVRLSTRGCHLPGTVFEILWVRPAFGSNNTKPRYREGKSGAAPRSQQRRQSRDHIGARVPGAVSARQDTFIGKSVLEFCHASTNQNTIFQQKYTYPSTTAQPTAGIYDRRSVKNNNPTFTKAKTLKTRYIVLKITGSLRTKIDHARRNPKYQNLKIRAKGHLTEKNRPCSALPVRGIWLLASSLHSYAEEARKKSCLTMGCVQPSVPAQLPMSTRRG